MASLAVLTTIGVNMLLETIKDKKDASLREEIKDRLSDTLSETQRRLQKLETSVTDLSVKACDNDEVEAIVKKRLE